MGFKARKLRGVRKLTESEVEFDVRIEPETEPPDRWFAYDTPEENERAWRWVLDELESGNELAWCCVFVTARWGAFEESTCLGVVSCADRKDLEENILPDMRSEALARLQAAIERAAADVAALSEARK